MAKKEPPKVGANRRERGTKGAHRSVVGKITQKLWGKKTGWDSGGEAKQNEKKWWK